MEWIHNAVAPAEYPPSEMCNSCEKHFFELEEARSVNVSQLFPSIKPAIYVQGGDLDAIEKATRKSLENVDMSRIKPDDTINVVTSEHGFAIMGGLPYLRMVKTILDVLSERTGNYRARVIMAMYRLPQEAEELKEFYKLEDYWGCEVIGTSPFEDGVVIDTKIGRFYGNGLAYDCDHFVYAYYDDPREQYCHRGLNRLFKAFVMNLGRVETRCSFHLLSSYCTNGMIPQAIYNSEFVQKRWAFATILNTNPNGVYDVFSDNDLYVCQRNTDINMLRDYTFIRLLFTKIGPWIAVLDGGKWLCYLHTAGQIFGCCKEAITDFYDLEVPWVATSCRPPKDSTGTIPQINKPFGSVDTFKGAVMNQTWIGLQMGFMMNKPYYCVGQEQWDMYENDRCNQGGGPGSRTVDIMHGPVDTLEDGLALAKKELDCENLICFDGLFGSINCNESAAEDIIRSAKGIEDETYDVYLPKYLKQRGYDAEALYKEVYHRPYKG